MNLHIASSTHTHANTVSSRDQNYNLKNWRRRKFCGTPFHAILEDKHNIKFAGKKKEGTLIKCMYWLITQSTTKREIIHRSLTEYVQIISDS
jgi:hypothetical protein